MSKRIDLTGQKFGEWTVLEYAGEKQWLCRCSCGTLRYVDGSILRRGLSTHCGCKPKQLEDLTGNKYGEWTVLKYNQSTKKWLCQCSCGVQKEVSSKDLKSGHSKSCGHSTSAFKDITGQQFGEWTVLEYAGEQKWKCRCSCGKIGLVNSKQLRNGASKSCGHASNAFKDLTGKTFGEWKVLKYNYGTRKWLCKCSCGKEEEIRGYDLTTGHTMSCGHNTTAFKDIAGKQFNELLAIEYAGNKQWYCKCTCGRIVKVSSWMLTSGKAKSCGCKSAEYMIKTRKEKYNEVGTTRINNPRTVEQIEYIRTKENLEEVLRKKFDEKPDIEQLSKMLNITKKYTYSLLRNFDMLEYVKRYAFSSHFETEIAKYITEVNPGIKIIQRNRTVLGGNELDIYLPEYNLAIEFNGTYWHSSINKDRYYHQKKSLECAKHRIRVIHIFEYEWDNPVKKEIIKNIIKMAINQESNTIIYARNTVIKEVNSYQSKEFINRYHLQGYTPTTIELGIFNKNTNELLGIMSFSKSRFDSKYEYEMIRMVWKFDTIVIGGTQKLFKHFITKYNPTSILSYCDFSKFIGNSYLKMGFKADKPFLTVPNYVWCELGTNKILSRYSTQKRRLLEKGLGTPEQTEDEIMTNLGYLKIYDCGNLKFIWRKGE